MSPTLSIRLLGGFSLTYNGEPLTSISSDRLQALLAGRAVALGLAPAGTMTRRFAAWTVFSAFVMACLLAMWPTRRFPASAHRARKKFRRR